MTLCMNNRQKATKEMKNTVAKYIDVIKTHDLYIVRRLFNPEAREFSWSQRNLFLSGRLDNIFVSNKLTTFLLT